MSTKIIVGLVLALIAVFGVQQCRVQRANARTYEADLGRANAEAKLDTTRRLTSRLLGDTARAYQRLVVQERQRQDDLDRELRLTRVALVSVTTSIRRLEARDVGGVTTTLPDSSQETRFLVREPPYTVDARIAHRSVTEPRLSALDVSLDSARIGARLSCGDRTGLVRPASLTLTTPTWLTARIDSVSQSPEVCSPPPRSTRRLSLGVTLGYSAVLDSGRVHHGPGGTVGVSYRFW